MTKLLEILIQQPTDLLDQLYENRSNIKPIHLAVAAEQKMRDACLSLKGRVDDSACSKTAKEYLATLKGYSLEISLSIDGGYTKMWRLNGERHREDGPAIEWHDGTKEWYLNGEQHRKNGPAHETADGGYKSWYLNGKLHKEDGPARVWSDELKEEWWLNGKQVTEEDVMGLDKMGNAIEKMGLPFCVQMALRNAGKRVTKEDVVLKDFDTHVAKLQKLIDEIGKEQVFIALSKL